MAHQAISCSGAMHAVLFWISVSVLSPLVLLVGLFNGRRRLLHDVVLGNGGYQQLGSLPGGAGHAHLLSSI